MAITQLCIRYNQPNRIPLAEDINKFHLYLGENAGTLRSLLETSPSEKTWRQLYEVTLLQILLFNKRKGGEMDRMKIDDYTKAITNRSPVQGQVAGSPSAFKKQTTKTIARVEMHGKRKRKVAMLLTANYTSQINLLIKRRREGNIDSQNLSISIQHICIPLLFIKYINISFWHAIMM